MRAIFVSYRRNDSEGEAGRLYDDLLEIFGDRSVFMDVAGITAGRDFRKAIDENVTKCGVLLALIGPGWLDAKDESGGRRLDDPGDFVRMETASALKRDVPVIPVLVHGARMPRSEQLPDDLKELAFRNCVELTHTRWKSDVKLLARALQSLLRDSEEPEAGHNPSIGRGLAQSIMRGPGVLLPTAQPKGVSQDIPAAATTAVAATVTAPACGGSLDPEAVARITRELAQYIGPIAEVIVRRAAKRCLTVAELRSTVSEEIEASADRSKFLNACPGA